MKRAFHRKTIFWVALALIAATGLFVTACGDSGGGDPTTPQRDAPNQPENTAAKPGVPRGVIANAITPTSIMVNWAAVSGATSYHVYRGSSASGTYTQVGTSSSASYIDTGLSADTTYYYKVSASNSAGESGQSSSVSAITPSSGSTDPGNGSDDTGDDDDYQDDGSNDIGDDDGDNQDTGTLPGTGGQLEGRWLNGDVAWEFIGGYINTYTFKSPVWSHYSRNKYSASGGILTVESSNDYVEDIIYSYSVIGDTLEWTRHKDGYSSTFTRGDSESLSPFF